MKRALVFALLVFTGLAGAATAYAYWSSQASDSGKALASALTAGNAPTLSMSGTNITISWSQVLLAGSPLGAYPGGGYIVRRYADSSSTPIVPGAGCSGTISGATATLSCTETSVPAGTWHYSVTPALYNWRGTESAQSAAPPVNSLTLSGQGGGGSFLSGSTLYYQGVVAGSFRVGNSVTSVGSSPASSDFAALGGTPTGWSHATPDLQTAPFGGPYVSNPFSWTAGTTSAPTETVTGTDVAGNLTTTTLTFTEDSTGPTGGALTVNGTTASSGGTSSLNRTGTFPIDARADYNADAGSGVASSVLAAQFAPWSGNACGTFGVASTITGNPTQTASSGDGCYMYTLTGTDQVGNTSQRITTVKVDQTAPATADNTASIGSAWYKTTQTVTLTPTDNPGSGVAQTYYTTDGSTPTTSSATGTSISLSATGVYTIKYFSTDNAGNQETVKTAGTQIHIDKTLPTDSLSLSSATNAFLSGSNLYFNKNSGGSFKLVDAVTDGHSGPASATFPAITTTGWTGHTVAETVSSGTGSAPTISYTSGTYTFAAAAGTPAATVTSTDVATNSSAGAALTFVVDTSATAPTLTFPTNTSHYNDGAWNSGCSSGICGTASDAGSGVQKVEVSIQQSAGNYWGGSGFSSSTQVWNIATGTTSWSLAFPAANFPAEGAYTVSVRVTDNVNNVSSSTSATITIDRTAPTATNVVLANGGTLGKADKGDTVTVTYGETMDASSFCSTWVNDGTSQTLNGNGVVVTIAEAGANDLLSVTGSGCTFHFGSVALNANYVSSTATFHANGANSSVLTWDPVAKTLTIKLGTFASGTQNTSVATSTPSYTPDVALKDTAGNGIGGGPYAGTLSRF
ncbi:MAG: OmpL47-type beta-barrel domain-containing protein [Actinomycetota bacterium]